MRIKKPVESQKTAPWANIERTKALSNVALPNDIMAMEAKEYVDENEK
jgi:hypothetical protein